MKITKKNGNISIYDDEKVVNSILKANEGTDEDYMNKAVAEDIAEDVFNRLTAVTEIITTKDVRTCVYTLLLERGFPETGKQYAEYKKL